MCRLTERTARKDQQDDFKIEKKAQTSTPPNCPLAADFVRQLPGYETYPSWGFRNRFAFHDQTSKTRLRKFLIDHLLD